MPVIILMTACGGKSGQIVSDSEKAIALNRDQCASVEGEWILEQVVMDDTLEVRPADIDPERKLYAHFYTDSSFNFQTGCNSIDGRFVQNGDSIRFFDMLITEMACDNMKTEQLLNQVLPKVKTVDWNNDSIVRLNTGSSAYVVLKKDDATVKCNEPK